MWLRFQAHRAEARGERWRQGARAAGKGARKAASAAAVAEAEDEDVDEEVLAAVAEELPKIHVALCVQLKARPCSSRSRGAASSRQTAAVIPTVKMQVTHQHKPRGAHVHVIAGARTL